MGKTGNAVPGSNLVPEAAEKKDFYPMWKLVLCALPQLSVQVLWCFLGPNSAPYMLHLGMTPALSTLNNIAGPITGFFTGPVVGATSDSLTLKMGRRRPVILAGLLSTWVAGMLFSGAEHFMPKGQAIFFAAPMYWVMDVTINILQTPHRALVSDLATEEQQVPMQVVFVVMMSIGNFLGFFMMKIFKETNNHMLELMLMVCALNTVCVGIQFVVAKEKQYRPGGAGAGEKVSSSPVAQVRAAVKNSSCLLAQLAGVQCLVWIGLTSWNNYGKQFFGFAVFQGDADAPAGSPALLAYEAGGSAFSSAGMWKAGVQLVSSLLIIMVLMNTKIRPKYVYAPCILIGAVVALLAAKVVGTDAAFAMVCMAFSVMPETGSFAIPFGLVATLNKKAEKEGKRVSTALQMSLLNCCVTVGQQVCTMSLASMLAGIEGTNKHKFAVALPLVFLISAGAQGLATVGALLLDDAPDDEEDGSSSSDDNSSDSSSA